MTRNAHHSPRSLRNLEQVQMTSAGQNDRRLESGVGDVAAAFQESSIVWMKRHAEALLRGSNLRIGRRSERAVGRNAHGVNDT